jgi:hypothetical protein
MPITVIAILNRLASRPLASTREPDVHVMDMPNVEAA